MADPGMRAGRERIRAATAAFCMTAVAGVVGCGGGTAGDGATTPAPAPAPPAAATVPAPPPSTGDLQAVAARVLGPDRAGEPTTLDGVYSEAQAQRGRAVFEAVCVECHTTDDWTEDNFLARWNGESLWRFWHYIYEQMPEGEPPYTLTRQQVSDATAYIFSLNGVPTGSSDLGTEDEDLDLHWLVWPGPS